MTAFDDTPRDAVDGLGLLLGRYADSVLKPDPFAMDRMRAELRARAQRASVDRRAEALAATAVAVAPAAGTSHRAFGRWSIPRLSFAMTTSLVIGLAVGTSTFAATRPGGPLYEARVAAEVALLPPRGDARLQAEVRMADARVADALEASAKGDLPALAAALEAYEDVVAMTTAEHQDGSHGLATAIAALRRHHDVLSAILGTVPAPAKVGIANAIAQSDKAIAHLQRQTPGRPADPGQPGTPGRPSDPGQPGQPDGGGAAETDKPTKTAKPDPTPRPDPTRQPTPTPRPDPTKQPTPTKKPVPTPSPANGGSQGGGGNQGGGGGAASPPASHGPPDGGPADRAGPPDRTPKPKP